MFGSLPGPLSSIMLNSDISLCGAVVMLAGMGVVARWGRLVGFDEVVLSAAFGVGLIGDI